MALLGPGKARTRANAASRRGNEVFFMQLEGIKTVNAQLTRVDKDLRRQLRSITREEFEKLLDKIKAATPVDTGRLRDSGRIKHLSTAGGAIRFDIMFGGKVVRQRLVDYAAAVHALHPTKSGWIDRVARNELPKVADRIAKRVRLKRRY